MTQGIFDLACKGEIDLHVVSSFDDESMPIFTVTLRFKGREVTEESDHIEDAINLAVWGMKDKRE